MKVNFKINNNTAIDFEEIHVDLHNNFDFLAYRSTKTFEEGNR